MSNRERWVVYPLLFLAISASLRDKITGHSASLQYITGDGVTIDLQHGLMQSNSIKAVHRIESQEVRGESIRGNEIRGQRLIVDEIHCRRLIAHDRRDKPVVILSSGDKSAVPSAGGGVRIYDGQGKAICSLDAGAEGGELTLGDKAGVLTLVLGHRAEGRASGLIAVAGDGTTAGLTPLIQRPTKTAPPAAGPADEPRPGQPPEPAEVEETPTRKPNEPAASPAAQSKRPT